MTGHTHVSQNSLVPKSQSETRTYVFGVDLVEAVLSLAVVHLVRLVPLVLLRPPAALQLSVDQSFSFTLETDQLTEET